MKICKEARAWLLPRLKNAHICEMLQRDPGIRTRICKGGFKPTPQNIEKNRRLIIQRLTALFNDNPTQLLITSVQHSSFRQSFVALQKYFPGNTFRHVWKRVLRVVKDHRAFILHLALESEDDFLVRTGVRLLNLPMLWKNDESWRARQQRTNRNATAGFDEFAAGIVKCLEDPLLNGVFLSVDLPRSKQVGLLSLSKASKNGKAAKGGAAGTDQDKEQLAANAPAAAEEQPPKQADQTPAPCAEAPAAPLPPPAAGPLTEAAAGQPGAAPAEKDTLPKEQPPQAMPQEACEKPQAMPQEACEKPQAMEGNSPVPPEHPAAEETAAVLPAQENTSAETDSAPSEERAALQERLTRGLQRDLALRKERDDLKNQVKALQAQASSKDAQLRDMQRRLDEVARSFAGAMEEMKTQREQDLLASSTALEAELLGVHPDLRLYAVQSLQTAGKLKERVEAALERQKAVNSKTMLRQELMRRLNRLGELQKRVNDAIEDAISPIPELTQLEREITREMEFCQQKLNEHLAIDNCAMPYRLRDHIKSLPYTTPDAMQNLEELRRTLDTPLWHSLLAPDELDAARHLIAERQKLCTIAQKVTTELARADGQESVISQLPHVLTLASVKEQLGRTMLVIDGHNAMLRDPFWSSQIQLLGEKNARNDFLQKLNHALGSHLRSITAVFDGQGITDIIENCGKVKVVYAAHAAEEQNADNCIVRILENLQDSERASDGDANSPDIMLCTDDGGLEARAAELCDAILETHALAAVLQ